MISEKRTQEYTSKDVDVFGVNTSTQDTLIHKRVTNHTVGAYCDVISCYVTMASSNQQSLSLQVLGHVIPACESSAYLCHYYTPTSPQAVT